MQASVMMKPNGVEYTQELGGYMTIARASVVLGIGETGVHEAVKRGSLRAIWITGRTVMVSKRSVDAYARRRESRKAGKGANHEATP